MKVNKCIRIKGRVQGVYFRKSTEDKARVLKLTGWVRNEPDGSVLTEIEGPEYAVQQMEQWLHSGPERAIVEEIIVNIGDLKGYKVFTVHR